MFTILLFGAVLQAAAVPAAPPQPAPADPKAQASVADQFICRTEQVTGSRFPQKVCRRKSEFAQKAADDQARIRQMQRPQYSCQTSFGAASC